MPHLARLAEPLNVVLVKPLIPGNTGNIARMCAVTGSRLHLVGPLGFSIADRDLKRAGLDYWDKVFVGLAPTFDELVAEHRVVPARLHLFTASASDTHFQRRFAPGDWLVFGQEDSGLAPELLARWPDRRVSVPQVDGTRSLNLSTCAGIAVYEALRQIAFSG